MVDPFYSPKLQISTAKTKIRSVNKSVKTFMNKKPYAAVVEPDIDGINQLHKMKFTKPIPKLIRTNTAYAVSCLRSALDQMGYAIAIANGNPKPRSHYFPFTDDPAQLVSHTTKRACKDLPPEIQALYMSFKPYKGGNDVLWALNKVRGMSEHAILAPVGFAAGGLRINTFNVSGECKILNPVWDSAKNEIVVAITGPDTEFDYNIDVLFNVGFGDVEGVGGQPAVPILYAFLAIVERILVATEAEARRIGII